MSRGRAREKLWVVRAGDGETVAAIVRRAGDDPAHAVAEGRVFVGKRRITDPSAKVAVGDAVRIGAPAEATRSSARGAVRWVRWEKSGLVFAAKEAGLPTVPDHGGASHSLVAQVARELACEPGALHVTSRLDREVSGVVLFARDEAAAERLRRAREEGTYTRRYVAIAACARPLPDAGAWDGAIGAGKDARHRAVGGDDAKPSRTRFRMIARAPGEGVAYALLALEPETGRTHQIRVHASHAGAPLLGDRDYGGATRFTTPAGRVVALGRIALHCARVTVPDTGPGERLVAEAEVPDELLQLWSSLGGALDAWTAALA